MSEMLPGLFNYWVAVVLMMTGFYVVVAQNNLVKKLVGLGLFQTSVFIFYISIGKVAGGAPPIIEPGVELYSNPLPHVLILTAIVVGVATTAVGLSLIVRIRETYDSVEEDDINQADREAELANSNEEQA
jgi:multicomponent Na+:H+ antiporter subunit C